MARYRFSAEELSFMERSRIPFAIYQFIDKRVVTLALSAGFCDLFGYELAEAYKLMDSDMYRDSHPDDVARIAGEAYRFATEGGEYNVAYRTKVGNEWRLVHAFGEHVDVESGERVAVIWYVGEGASEDAGADVGTLADAIGRAVRDASRAQDSRYDRLTGLPSMTHFYELAEAARSQIVRSDDRPALMFFNMRGMKLYNYKHGFAEGDRLICAFARELAGRFGADNCGRISKDNFVAVAPASGIEGRLDELLAACGEMNGGSGLPVQAGVYIDRGGDPDVGTACDKAQHACKLEKDAYASGYRFFDDGMLDDVQRSQHVRENLDRALAEGWVEVHHQAIVRAVSGQASDEEALARWADPELGMLAPVDFIPVLEASRQIYKLDLHILELVLDKMARQAEAGLNVVPQSVNLSRADFGVVDIVEEVRRRVDEAGVPRGMIAVEVTESAVASDFEFMRGQIERFRELGFQVWMDDFGSGYSSLDVLQDIRFDVIKLDMHFLRGLAEGDAAKVIITELVRMAAGLGVETVAEGVESKEQADFLKEVGCNRLQGFYYSRPVPSDAAIERGKQGPAWFEDPREAEYYAEVGRVSLYDAAAIALEAGAAGAFFDTMPMAVLEVRGDEARVIRSNGSCRDFIGRMFGIELDSWRYSHSDGTRLPFMEAIRRCAESGELAVIDHDVKGGATVHAVAKKVAENPVTGGVAVVAAVVAVAEGKERAMTYARVARALSDDYLSVYVVDPETERYEEYSSAGDYAVLGIAKEGEDFFERSREECQWALHEDDRERFAAAFEKEAVLAEIARSGSFTIAYRLLVEGKPVDVALKAVLAEDESGRRLIVGVKEQDHPL